VAPDSICFSRDASLLLGKTLDGLKVWDIQTGTERSLVKNVDNSIWKADLSTNRKRVATISGLGKLTVHDVSNPLRQKVLLDKGIQAIGFSPDDAVLAAGSADGLLYLFHADQEKPFAVLKTNAKLGVQVVRFFLNKKRIAVGTLDGLVQIWDIEKAVRLWHSELMPGIYALDVSRVGDMICAGGHDGTVFMWRLGTDVKLLHTLKRHENAVHSLSFSADGSKLVSGSWDGEVTMWDVATGSSSWTASILHRAKKR
jgi:WD40 repeat protein